MIKAHLTNVLTQFVHTITRATTEALNGVIKKLAKRAYGFRSFANFRTAILFHYGHLQLYPSNACGLQSPAYPDAPKTPKSRFRPATSRRPSAGSTRHDGAVLHQLLP